MESSSHPGPASPGGTSRIPPVNGVGKPCAGEPHARIDGRGLETERCTGHGHDEKQPRREPAGPPPLPALPPIHATAPAPDPPPVFRPQLQGTDGAAGQGCNGSSATS